MTIHHVYANRSNIGDWLSARGIQKLISPEPVVEHLCDRPFIADTLERLKGLDESDLVIIGGGGLFMDYFDPFWIGFEPVSRRVPYVIWGAGCCEMKRQKSGATELLKSIVQQSRLFLPRDFLTLEVLGLPGSREPIACPSMIVMDGVEMSGSLVLNADAYDNIGEVVHERIVKDSRAYAARNGFGYFQTDNTISQGREPDLCRLLHRYRQAAVIVASRLHGCILGVALGKKVIAISGDHKVESFMQMAGLGDWVLDFGEIDQFEQLLSQIADQPDVSDFVASTKAGNRQFASEVLDLASMTNQR